MQRPNQSSSTVRAYTLIELLVVIGIIGILMAIAVAVGSNVVGGGKSKSTSDVLKTLDTALAQYMSGRNGKAPLPFVTHPIESTHPSELIPIVDGEIRLGMGGRQFMMANSAAFFVLQSKDVSAADNIIKGIPTRFMRDYTSDPDADPDIPVMPTPIDAWGNPIRYVHPSFDGALYDNPGASNPAPTTFRQIQDVLDNPPNGRTFSFTEIRRAYFVNGGSASDNAKLTDGGTCVGDRGYFYSLGPDGKAGFERRADGSVADYNADNIYSTKPNLPKDPFR